MSPIFRSIRIPALAALACLVLAALPVAEGAAMASPVVRATRSCSPPKYPGAGYFSDKIRVTGISCAYAKKFVVAYYKCRTRGAGKTLASTCTRKVNNFSCKERRNSIPTEIDATVTCRRGSTQRIVHTYQQNLDG